MRLILAILTEEPDGIYPEGVVDLLGAEGSPPLDVQEGEILQWDITDGPTVKVVDVSTATTEEGETVTRITYEGADGGVYSVDYPTRPPENPKHDHHHHRHHHHHHGHHHHGHHDHKKKEVITTEPKKAKVVNPIHDHGKGRYQRKIQMVTGENGATQVAGKPDQISDNDSLHDTCCGKMVRIVGALFASDPNKPAEMEIVKTKARTRKRVELSKSVTVRGVTKTVGKCQTEEDSTEKCSCSCAKCSSWLKCFGSTGSCICGNFCCII